MYGITFNVDFEAEILEIDFGQFAFFHRGETKMSEMMSLAQQIQLLKTLESKFSLLGWCRNDKLWDRIDNSKIAIVLRSFDVEIRESNTHGW